MSARRAHAPRILCSSLALCSHGVGTVCSHVRHVEVFSMEMVADEAVLQGHGGRDLVGQSRAADVVIRSLQAEGEWLEGGSAGLAGSAVLATAAT